MNPAIGITVNPFWVFYERLLRVSVLPRSFGRRSTLSLRHMAEVLVSLLPAGSGALAAPPAKRESCVVSQGPQTSLLFVRLTKTDLALV
jgi:hypothetical protein